MLFLLAFLVKFFKFRPMTPQSIKVSATLTQVVVRTTEGNRTVPAVVTGQLAVNTISLGKKDLWCVTHVKSGMRIAKSYSFFAAFHASLLMEKLTWDWVNSAVRADGSTNPKKVPRGIEQKVKEAIATAEKWEIAVLRQGLGNEQEAK